MIKHMHLPRLALASAAIAMISGCSSDPDPTPTPTAGAAGVAGAPVGFGGAPAGAGGSAAGRGGTGGTAAGSGGAATGAAGAGQAGSTGDPAQGQSAYMTNCSACHGNNAAGSIGPNITGSMTAGIGSWSEATFTRSVREAVDKDGMKLCSLMMPYAPADLSDAHVKNIFAYLMTLKNDTVNRGSCP